MQGPPDFIIRKKNRTQYGGVGSTSVTQPYTKKRGYTSGSMGGGGPPRTSMSQGGVA